MSNARPEAEPAAVLTGETLCAVADIAPGHSKGFRVVGQTSPVAIFLVRPRDAGAGEIYGYVNQCAHRSMPLEWVEDEFLDDARETTICATHGALFRIADGVCVGGPCPGKSLQAVALEVRDGVVHVKQPPRYR